MPAVKGMGASLAGWGSRPKMAVGLTCKVPCSDREEEGGPGKVRGREKPTQQSLKCLRALSPLLTSHLTRSNFPSSHKSNPMLAYEESFTFIYSFIHPTNIY